MRSVTGIVLFILHAQVYAHAEERAGSVQSSVDHLVDNYVASTVEAPRLQHGDLGNTTLGFPGHVAVAPRRSGALLSNSRRPLPRVFRVSQDSAPLSVGFREISARARARHNKGSMRSVAAFDSAASGKGPPKLPGVRGEKPQPKTAAPTEPPAQETIQNYIAVFGATGRTGQLVVQELLNQGYNVKALVRNQSKASAVLPIQNEDAFAPVLKTVDFDVTTASADAIRAACKGARSVIWCAAGFTEDGQSIDIKGMGAIPAAFREKPVFFGLPRVVMVSSAGVTRPSWGPYRQEKLVGAFDIPIVNLNPFQVLNRKAEAEELLRQSGVPYCIVRPTGLKFDGSWPRGRPILSQGDVAVGRANAVDVAKLVVDVVNEPAATGKTFEMFTLQGYPAPLKISSLLEPLRTDAEGAIPDAAALATYNMLQQMLPGAEQDATKLEMGRTYEQVDKGEVNRQRGAAPTEREKALATRVQD